jgi:hypothetical protein
LTRMCQEAQQSHPTAKLRRNIGGFITQVWHSLVHEDISHQLPTKSDDGFRNCDTWQAPCAHKKFLVLRISPSCHTPENFGRGPLYLYRWASQSFLEYHNSFTTILRNSWQFLRSLLFR